MLILPIILKIHQEDSTYAGNNRNTTFSIFQLFHRLVGYSEFLQNEIILTIYVPDLLMIRNHDYWVQVKLNRVLKGIIVDTLNQSPYLLELYILDPVLVNKLDLKRLNSLKRTLSPLTPISSLLAVPESQVLECTLHTTTRPDEVVHKTKIGRGAESFKWGKYWVRISSCY